MNGRYRWMVGSLVVLAMSSAWAGGGEKISFTGAVVEPTCAADAVQIDSTGPFSSQAGQAPRHLICGQTATDPGQPYSRTVQAIDATRIAHDRLLGYFASYAVGPDGKPVANLVTRTYD